MAAKEDLSNGPNAGAGHQAAAQDDIRYPTGVKLVIIMTSLMLGTTLMSLDTTIISVATPKITTQFHALDDVGWYGAAYLMTLTAMTPIAANLYKYFDPKMVYLAFIVLFESEITSHFKTTFVRIASDSSRASWLDRLRLSAHIPCFHHRQSYRRPGSCGTASRSLRHSDICLFPPATSIVPGDGCQFVRSFLKYRTCHRRGPDGKSDLEMVFLDVRGSQSRDV